MLWITTNQKDQIQKSTWFLAVDLNGGDINSSCAMKLILIHLYPQQYILHDRIVDSLQFISILHLRDTKVLLPKIGS